MMKVSNSLRQGYYTKVIFTNNLFKQILLILVYNKVFVTKNF